MTPQPVALAEAPPPVPGLDAGAAMPAWWGLFSVLLVLTFAVHVVFMNLTLGGSVLLLAGRLARNPDGLLSWLGDEVGHLLPVVVSLTITTGVAPLLFAQVLYPQFFYAASILLGRFWLLIILLLIVGFYGLYLYLRLVPAAAAPGRRLLRLAVLVVSVCSFFTVAYLFTNHAVTTVEPRRWQLLHAGHKSLHVGSRQMLPRLLHTFVGAAAVTGLFVACLGQVARCRRGEAERGRRATRAGMQVAVAATLVQMLVGIWFLLAVDPGPREHLYNPMAGGAGSVAWMAGIVAAVAGMWFMLRAWLEPDSLPWTLTACGAILLTLLGMSAGRETLRLGYLSEFLAAESFPPPQWKPDWQVASLVIFVVTLAVGLAVVWLVVRWWWESGAASGLQGRPSDRLDPGGVTEALSSAARDESRGSDPNRGGSAGHVPDPDPESAA